MRIGFRCLALSGLLVLIAAAPMSAEKIRVKCDYDRSNDFARYKRYSLGKNFLLTHQTPEVQAHINQVLVESLNRHLQGKGFILDQRSSRLRDHLRGGLPRQGRHVVAARHLLRSADGQSGLWPDRSRGHSRRGVDLRSGQIEAHRDGCWLGEACLDGACLRENSVSEERLKRSENED